MVFIPIKSDIQKTGHEKKVDTGRLTSFGEVELRGPVGALTVVDALHVTGVLVQSSVQHEAVSCQGLQGLLFVAQGRNLKTKKRKKNSHSLSV